MGLDVYLYTREQAEQNDRHGKASEAFYGDPAYESWDEDERKRRRADMPEYAHMTDVPSEKHPEHLFNRRYLRSSYNGSGFNSAVPELLGDETTDLYSIFAALFDVAGKPDTDALGWLYSEHVEALGHCRDRALDVAERLRSIERPLRVLTVSANQLSGTGFLDYDEQDALRIYREAVGRGMTSDGWASSRDLTTFGAEGDTFLAAVPGGERMFFNEQRWPAVHLIYRMSDDTLASYVASAEITAEFCVEAIHLIEQDGSAYMSWSG